VLENPNIQSSTKYGSVETYKEKEGYSSVDSYREIVQNVTKSISDEIRTSLDLIRKYSLQLKEKISDEETQTILQKILDETTSISRAIQAHEDFLSEKINLNAQIYFAEPVLSDIIRLLEGYTEFRGVKLSGKFEADSAILIDKNLFFQAMLQVVKIMCEEIQENGNINITIKRANSSLILELVNTASKLPESVLGCINRQVLISDNPGLNYAKNIIREHGGIISAWNNLNEGSQINIKIPVVK
ncbi:MAG: HAMP domain-containing histidine kinase, partial [Ignavibacteriaceae bacterium]|nr:HAMP domain-containing histidine kinase [Ignavibacteriaceae bacterium]